MPNRNDELDAAAGSPDSKTQSQPDASNGTPDTPMSSPDAPSPPQGAAKLIITEVALTPTLGEFIEIMNPTAQTVSLDNYYLSDSQRYFKTSEPTPTVDSTDFIVRFPAGATLAPGAVATVSMSSAADFQATTGVAPTYAFGAMRSVAVSGTPALTNGGEMIALFWWNGSSDLVKDCDLVNVGSPSASNSVPNKSGVAIDGPDGGTDASVFASEAMTLAATTATPGNNLSLKRVKYDTSYQAQAMAGNAVDGGDETSEMIGQTWGTVATAPTPGTASVTP